jgi:glutamyl-tRNA reductase
MEIISVGLDCKKAPVEIREKISFVGHYLTDALAALVSRSNINEAVILSTCNRVEIYVCSEHTRRDDTQASLINFLAEFHEVEAEEFAHLLYFHCGRAAANHLFEVASGIQSMVLGEAQIQGQVREAIEVARKHGAAGRVMDALFRAALSTGKRARTETAIGENGVSVSFTAVELLKEKVGSLQGKTGLVIGSGITARLSAQILMSAGVSDILIVNRSHENARELVHFLNLSPHNAFTFPEMEDALAQADVVISCTGAPHTILHKAQAEHALVSRPDRPLYMVDIAVPRDIDPDMNEVEGVHAWDIDDIKRLADHNMDKRRAEVHHVRTIVIEELNDFMAWMGALAVVPTITNLRRHADAIRKSELERVKNSFGDLSDRQNHLLEELTSRIVNKLLHEPTLRLKEAASNSDGGRYAEVVQHLFSLQGVGNEAN